MLGERVEKGVARRVVGLAGERADTRDGREHDERRQLRVPRQLVQIDRPDRLGPQRSRDLLPGEVAEQRVVQLRGRVHDRVDAVPRQDDGQLVPVADVTGGDGHPRTGGGQLGDQVVGAGRRPPTPPEQQQMLRAAPGEPPCHMGAERPRTTGHHDGPRLGTPVTEYGRVRQRCPPQPPREHAGGPYGQFVLFAPAPYEDVHQTQYVGLRGLGRQIHDAAPHSAALLVGDPAEAPDEGSCRVGDMVCSVDGDRSGGEGP